MPLRALLDPLTVNPPGEASASTTTTEPSASHAVLLSGDGVLGRGGMVTDKRCSRKQVLNYFDFFFSLFFIFFFFFLLFSLFFWDTCFSSFHHHLSKD